jgi:tRNA U38,U39,U40 pseudouridine synthase TruA
MLQVVQFHTNVANINVEKLPYRLNSLMPPDIRVMWAHQTAPDFNVTCSAREKVRRSKSPG